MRWQDVSEKLKSFGSWIYKKRRRSRTLWIGGSGGILGFILLLGLLTGVNITTTGDIYCDSECVSYFNITTSYWRICFDPTFSPIFTDKNIRTELYVPTYGKKWRLWNPEKDCIDRRKINRFMIKGYKNPEDTVKWGVALKTIFKDYVDPLWKAEDEITYTPSTKTICREIDGKETCNLVLYSGTRFVEEDDEWKDRKEARSLKNKGFSVVYLKDDGIHQINVTDFNDTSIQFGFNYDADNIGEYEYEMEEDKMKTKYKIIELLYNETSNKSYEFVFEYEIEIEEGIPTNVVYYENPFGKKFSLGNDSTTIKLQDADTQNLEDTWVDSLSPTTNFGTDSDLISGLPKWDDRSSGVIYIKWNISAIPASQTIDLANFSMYFHTRLGSSAGCDITAHQVYNSVSWIETGPTWNNQPCGTGFDNSANCNLTAEDTETVVTTTGVWHYWKVTDMVQKAYDDGDTNVSIGFKPTCELSDTVKEFYSKERSTTSQRPILEITYSSAGPVDTCTAPGSGDWAITCSDNCTWTTNQIIPDNITITGSGILVLNANFTFTQPIHYISIASGCQLAISSRGSIY